MSWIFTMWWRIDRNASKDIKIIRKIHTVMPDLKSNICRCVLYILEEFLKNIPKPTQKSTLCKG